MSDKIEFILKKHCAFDGEELVGFDLHSAAKELASIPEEILKEITEMIKTKFASPGYRDGFAKGLKDARDNIKRELSSEIKRELEENHPYSESIFVRTANETLALMREHGLTDAEITGINGSACRAGYDAAIFNVETTGEREG